MRRYSRDDLAVIRRAAQLAGEGVNLAGVRHILRREAELAELRTQAHAAAVPAPRRRRA